MRSFAVAFAALAGIAGPAAAQEYYAPPAIGGPVLPSGMGSILEARGWSFPSGPFERVKLDAGTAIGRCAIAVSAQAGNQVTAINNVRYSRNGLRVTGAVDSDQTFRCNVDDLGRVTSVSFKPNRA
ncbi:hypothetical protein G7077_11115 [Sphingomonas piscis]|uniref:Uncharacterized protein n=1 Tax=Sphingomonas piscis TaxID=2714943 RepID=A0A6G7YRK3_9SPHN|nr:hypothetical protein [Sphingomonas piscis]QIK79370.1 hypothetical protein G7077_11115 [Sphingomonas piscis]